MASPLPSSTTALVLIDLQKGILARELAPHSSDVVIANAQALAMRFRAAGAPVVWVNVKFSGDMKDFPLQHVDQPMAIPPGGFPAGFSDLVDGLAEPGDILVTKRQWGAFYGTDLDLQLRRRGMTGIVLGGVSTNIGVESTARQAWEHGYHQVFAEDATSVGGPAEMHAFAFKYIFPRIGHVAKTADIVLGA
jgi:nicotinamidase-related amidase